MERDKDGRMFKPGLNCAKKTIHHHRDHRKSKSKSRGVWRLVTLDTALEQRRNLERAARAEKWKTQNTFMDHGKGFKQPAPSLRPSVDLNTAFIADDDDTAPNTGQFLIPSTEMFYNMKTALARKAKINSQLEMGRPGEGMGMKSYLSLNDLKMCNELVFLKSFKDINMLIPTQGFGIESQEANNDNLDLENSISIETLTVNIQDSIMRSGFNVFQVSPIIFVKPVQVKFCPMLPAIVQVPLTLDPSSGDEACCLHSASLISESSGNYSDMLWSFEAIDNCWIRDDKVCFETFQLGCFVIVIRPKCSYSSRTQEVNNERLESGKDVVGEEVLENEGVSQAHDIVTQLEGKVQPGVKINNDPFGPGSRHVMSSTRQDPENIFNFNIQKKTSGEDMSTKDEKVLMELANSLYITEDRNWKIFAYECGMSNEDIFNADLRSDDQPLQKILKKYLRESRADAMKRLLGALYKCYRKLDCGGGKSFNKFPRSSHSDKSMRSANIGRLLRSSSNDSFDYRTLYDSGHSGGPSKRKRSYDSSLRDPQDGVHTSSRTDGKWRLLSIPKRQDLSREKILESEVPKMEEQLKKRKNDK